MLNDEITMLTVASGVCRFSKVSEGSTREPAPMAEPRQFFFKCYFILQSGFHCLKKRRPFLSNFFQYLLWQRKLRKQKALCELTKKHCPLLWDRREVEHGRAHRLTELPWDRRWTLLAALDTPTPQICKPNIHIPCVVLTAHFQ